MYTYIRDKAGNIIIAKENTVEDRWLREYVEFLYEDKDSDLTISRQLNKN